MHVMSGRGWSKVLLVAAALTLSGCSFFSRPASRAPVEDRGPVAPPPSEVRAIVPSAVEPTVVKPVDSNAGRPGYYTVKPGDTLIRIGLDTGQNWRDIVRWNNIENPNLIEVGQVFRVIPPTAASVAAAAAAETGVVTRPVAAASVPAATPLAPASAPRPATTVAVAPPSAQTTTTAPVAPPPPPGAEDDLAFIWPVSGSMITGFDETKNKGVDLAGKSGDAVLAAADGKVVYAGAGLRGYGNLIILQHKNAYLTAYAHNQTLLVKEEQTVRKGQKVAEMGNSDADRVKLHFEIRRQGKPVDPTKYLPARTTP